MITDIVGYSKMSGDNQDLALTLLKEHDQILFNYLEKYNGDVLKNRGDGVIAQFEDCSNSIKCAVDIQRDFKKRNSLNTKERNLRVRIGIHYGEFVKDGEEIHGDCINVASKLEPLAPYGGILISKELAKLVVDHTSIYIREYEKFKIEEEEELTYEVYIDLIDWYNNKNCKKSFISSNDLVAQSHESFHRGDFSASIKETVLCNENSNEVDIRDTNSFLSNLFINIGDFNQAKVTLNNVMKNIDENSDLKGHIMKLQGHLFFNEELWLKANKYYDQSLNIFIDKKSKYINEIIFFKGLIDIINEEKELSIKELIDSISIEDSYFELISIMENYFNNNKSDYNQDIDLNRIQKLENNRYKSYGFWLMSKIMAQLELMDRAYDFETKAQELIKKSSKDISDKYLRSKYLKEVLLHKIIMTETSINVESLFDFNEAEDELEGIIDFSTFSFCVNCGNENNKKTNKCVKCETILIKEYYEKN